MNKLRIVLVLACAVLLAGCLPVTTKTPVGTTAGLGADPALFGTWVGHSEDASAKNPPPIYFHFMLGKDGTMTAAYLIATGTNDDEWLAFALHTATLGGNRYIDALNTLDNGKPVEGDLKTLNIPLLYTLKGKTLTLYLLDEDKARAAVKSGAIAGTVGAGDSGDVVITADAKALDAFMAKPETAKLFKVLIVLKRID